jgi:two-component system response regulator YesN
MKILIVDDQISVVEGLLSGINWEKLGVSKVFGVHSAQDARLVLDREPVDLILCDIEMPVENGIELLRWVREHHPETEAVLLTAHASFEYAKDALHLNCFDYLVQPIRYADLEACLIKFRHHLENKSHTQRLQEFGTFIASKKETLIRRFWHSLLLAEQEHALEQIAREIDILDLKSDVEHDYLVLLNTIISQTTLINMWDEEKTVVDIIKKIQNLFGRKNQSHLVAIDREHFVLILPAAPLVKDGLDYFYQNTRLWVDACSKSLNIELACYIGRPTPLNQLHKQYKALKDLERVNISHYADVYALDKAVKPRSVDECRFADRWPEHFANGNHELFQRELDEHIASLEASQSINGNTLFIIHQSLTHSFFSSLKLRDLPTDLLFQDDHYMTLYIDARRSLENLYRFVDYLLAINNEQPKLVSSAELTIVEKLKQYIQSHIDRPLTRKELSDFIYLSPDHITHLFREKTGISLIEYINTLKMEKAAALLAETNMPVGLISSRVGFTSFSYFSKMFKKKTGLSPVEYRKKHE